MYHDETDHGDVEDAWTFSKKECHRVELRERLRGIEREERVQFRNAEREEDGEHACGDRARDD